MIKGVTEKLDSFVLNNKESLSLLARNLTIVFVLGMLLQIFRLLNVNRYLNLNWFAFGVFLINTIALIYYFRTLGIQHTRISNERLRIINNFYKYGFLFLLLFLVLMQLLKLEWSGDYNIILAVITVFFGVINFYQNREVTEQGEEATKEQKEGKK